MVGLKQAEIKRSEGKVRYALFPGEPLVGGCREAIGEDDGAERLRSKSDMAAP